MLYTDACDNHSHLSEFGVKTTGLICYLAVSRDFASTSTRLTVFYPENDNTEILLLPVGIFKLALSSRLNFFTMQAKFASTV
jgi:hypothetical protein